jgi:hypothetical protein
MITIEFQPEEAQFIFENIANLNVSLAQENAPVVAQLGNSVLTKLKGGIEAFNAANAKPQLASAAKDKPAQAASPNGNGATENAPVGTKGSPRTSTRRKGPRP